MQRLALRGLALYLAVIPLLVPGCITINAFEGGREPLVETVVDGDSGPKVLLLDIDGLISEMELRGPLGVRGRESTVARVREQLDRASDDREIGALLIRINSPGGTVTASDLVYHEIVRFKQERDIPVVAQLMGIAASGGYYIAMSADEVRAQPTTITGSIGVISASLNFSGLMEKVGVSDQTITSGKYKDVGSPLRPMTPEERAYLQALVNDLEKQFRGVVAAGRPALGKAQLDQVADGRVFTASQAEDLGLVDGIGYLPDSVAALRRRLGAPEVRVVSYHRPREWRTNLYSMSPAPPRSQADLGALLNLGSGPTFLYLWSSPAL